MKPEEMAKALTKADPAVVEILKSMTDANASLTSKVETLAKSLHAELTRARKAEAVEVAKSLKHIPGMSVDDMAETIRKAKDGDAGAGAKLVTMLEKANAALAKRLPIAPVGSTGVRGEPGSAKAELEALVEKRMGEVRKSASGGSYSKEQAFTDVMMEAPADLIERLSQENQS